MDSIDIFLPIYKPNHTVYESINSIINQSYKNWHLYIIDDASKDDCLNKLKIKYEAYSNKITYFHFDENKRAAACRIF